jgi:hypothetical protein
MQFGVIILTLAIYGLAIYLIWAERSYNYLIALISGNLLSLLSPLWQSLYGFSYSNDFATWFTFLGNPLPSIIFTVAWTVVLPPLIIFYLYRHNWWISNYTTAMITFVAFVLYFQLLEMIGVRAGWWCYSGTTALPFIVSSTPTAISNTCFGPTLAFGLPVTLLSAIMNGLIALGTLSALILTSRYAWTSLLVIVLPIPLLLSLFVNGLLGAPLYSALLLQAQASWAGALGMLGTLGLLIWAAHIVASALNQRDWNTI